MNGLVRTAIVGALALSCLPAAAFGAAPTISAAPLAAGLGIGAPITIAGRVHGGPSLAAVALEQLAGNGPDSLRWDVVARGLVDHGAFAFTWRPVTAGPRTVRIAVRAGGRDLATTSGQSVRVGQPPAFCNAAPVRPAVPASSGWVSGALLVVTAGKYTCPLSGYTVTVADPRGAIVATRAVSAGQSFAIVLPPGSYTLASGGCSRAVDVVAGREAGADIVCGLSPPFHICSGCGLAGGADLRLCKQGQASTVANPCATI